MCVCYLYAANAVSMLKLVQRFDTKKNKIKMELQIELPNPVASLKLTQ